MVGVVRSARGGSVLLRRLDRRGSSSLLRRGRERGGAWARPQEEGQLEGRGPPVALMERQHGARSSGRENGDLRLDKGLAIRPVADLWVEGLHAGAKVRPHQDGDVDRVLCPPGALCNILELVALAKEGASSEGCGRYI